MKDIGSSERRGQRAEGGVAQFGRANPVNQRGWRRLGLDVGQYAFAHRATIALS
jgi:hypothetical protein